MHYSSGMLRDGLTVYTVLVDGPAIAKVLYIVAAFGVIILSQLAVLNLRTPAA